MIPIIPYSHYYWVGGPPKTVPIQFRHHRISPCRVAEAMVDLSCFFPPLVRSVYDPSMVPICLLVLFLRTPPTPTHPQSKHMTLPKLVINWSGKMKQELESRVM